jgi:hypothetical protein
MTSDLGHDDPARTSAASTVAELGTRFWQWRARQQPLSRDDVPRIERPRGWLPSWSPAAVTAWRADLAVFREHWDAIDAEGLDDGALVDYHLLGSALARVHWELDVVRGWRKDPCFHVDQSLGVVYDLLLPPPPLDDDRAEDVLRALATVPDRLEQARACLDGHAAGPFADVARSELASVEDVLAEVASGLAPAVGDAARADLDRAAQRAGAALGAFRDWLGSARAGMDAPVSVGREGFEFFLRDVALWPYSPGELLAIGRQEFARSVTLEHWSHVLHGRAEPPPLPAGTGDLVERARADEEAVRRFYEQGDWLSQPSTLHHYLFLEMPRYLAPLSWLGVPTDHTSATRLHEHGTSYRNRPSAGMPYFYGAGARDPRTAIVHEGVHYQQLTLSWGHPDPLRRQYYDSGPNEGIAFYNEELMLRAGLFDGSPWAQQVIHNFMRLRALRVEVDVRLSTDDLDIPGAARYLMDAVPLDRETAEEEAHMFAATPGQGLTYQIGKHELLRLLSDAILADPGGFSLRRFHDYVWLNGNVPFALQRLELLGDRSDLVALGKAPR